MWKQSVWFGWIIMPGWGQGFFGCKYWRHQRPICQWPVWLMVGYFSHPFLGIYEVIQFFELVNLEGIPFRSGMTSIPFHHTMVWVHTIPPHTMPYHTIPPHTIPSHLIPYHCTSCHTIPYHTIQYHTTSYHTIIPNLSQGGWGPFYKIWKLFLQAAKPVWELHFLWTGSSQFFWHCKLQVKGIGWTWLPSGL